MFMKKVFLIGLSLTFSCFSHSIEVKEDNNNCFKYIGFSTDSNIASVDQLSTYSSGINLGCRTNSEHSYDFNIGVFSHPNFNKYNISINYIFSPDSFYDLYVGVGINGHATFQMRNYNKNVYSDAPDDGTIYFSKKLVAVKSEELWSEVYGVDIPLTIGYKFGRSAKKNFIQASLNNEMSLKLCLGTGF